MNVKSESKEYVIPVLQSNALKSAWLMVGLPIAFAFYEVAAGGSTREIVAGAISGFVVAFVAFMMTTFVLAIRLSSKQRAVYAAHDYDWYRRTFPAHVHDKGHVSCRHCGGHKINTKNLMKSTYTRAHVCDQCGKSLYFSPEVSV